jgi:hypothetical protein
VEISAEAFGTSAQSIDGLPILISDPVRKDGLSRAPGFEAGLKIHQVQQSNLSMSKLKSTTESDTVLLWRVM